MTWITGSSIPLFRALAFAAGLVATLLGLSIAVERVGVEPADIQADFAARARVMSEGVAVSRLRFDHQIVMLGDSMLLDAPGQSGEHVLHARLEQRLNRLLGSRGRVLVHRFARPGAGYSTFYFFAAEIAKARPDLVLIELNPISLEKSWRTGKWVRTDLVAWLGAERLPEALRLPLHRLGLTTDRVLWLVACAELGCDGAWSWTQRRQVRVAGLHERARARLAAGTGLQARELFRSRVGVASALRDSTGGVHGLRYTRAGYATRYSHAFSGVPEDDVSLRLLAATVRHLVTAGVDVLVFAVPINVENMQAVGVYDAAGLRTTLDHAEAVVEQAGGRFVDLHDLLGDEHFRDPAGHLTWEGRSNGTVRLARELAAHVAEALAEDRSDRR